MKHTYRKDRTHSRSRSRDRRKSDYDKSSSKFRSGEQKKSENSSKYCINSFTNSKEKDSKRRSRSKSKERTSTINGMSAEEIRKMALSIYEDISKGSNQVNSGLTTYSVLSVAKKAEIYETPKPPKTRYRVQYTDERKFESPKYYNVMGDVFPVSKGEVHKISEMESMQEFTTENVNNDEINLNAHFFDYSYLNKFNNRAYISPYGAKLLKRMGWHDGEGLGKCRHGAIEALMFETKNDRKGLASMQEKWQQAAQEAASKKISVNCAKGKSPISALMEFCQKRRITLPQYNVVEETGPSNMPQFRISVTVMDQTFVSEKSYSTKREAKSQSASIAIETLDL